MTFYDALGILAVLAEIFILVVFLYYRTRGNVAAMVVEFIALAEQTGKPGPEKMDMVVEALYKYIPVAFRGILTRERLRAMAQDAFDWMKTYALEYLEGKAGGGSSHPPGESDLDGHFADEENTEPGSAEVDGEDELFTEDGDIVPEIVEGEEG